MLWSDVEAGMHDILSADGVLASPVGDGPSKVPHVTLAFWVIKICAITVGETGGDALSMTLQLGYAVSTLIFLAFFCLTLAVLVGSRHYRPFVYWAVVMATTTVGTTMSDYLDRTYRHRRTDQDG